MSKMPNVGKKFDRIFQWLLSLGLASFLPFATYGLHYIELGSSYSFLENISPHRELLIVSFALVGEAFGNTLRRQIKTNTKTLIYTVCFLFASWSLFYFARISNAALIIDSSYNFAQASQNSLITYCVAIGICTACNIAGKA